MSYQGQKSGQRRAFLLRRFDAVASLHHVPPPSTHFALSRPELEALLAELFGEAATRKQTVAEQREEIARLQGLKGPPNIKPSGMDKGGAPTKPPKEEKRPGRGKAMPRVSVEERVIKAEIIPPGSRFKARRVYGLRAQ